MSQRVDAAVLRAARELEIARVDLPEPGPADVLVEVRACAVCGTNVHAWTAFPGRGPARRPGTHGHEVAGVVVAAGRDVEGLAAGDLVCLEPVLACACGACPPCRAGDALGCRAPRPLAVWGFAEAMVVPARGLVRVPAGLPAELACLAEPLASAVHGVRHSATAVGGRIEGAVVAVLGGGPLGLLAAVAARHLGAARVAVAARYDHQRRAAAALGADDVLAADDPATADALRRLAPGLVVEAVGGRAPTLATAFAVVARRGEVVVLGLFDEAQALDVTAAVHRNVRAFFAVAYGELDGVADMGVSLEVLAGDPDRFAPLVSHRFPLARVGEAFATAADRRSGSHRVVVEPSEARTTSV